MTEAQTAPEKTKTKKPANALITVNAKALSVDVGPFVVAGLAKADADQSKLEEQLHGVASKRYDLLAQTTQAIVKAADADKAIDLSASFTEDKAAMNRLMAQVGLALGLREVIKIGKGDKAKPKLATARAVAKYFPKKGDDPADPETKRKQTFRTNFTHLLKKCVQAAHTIIEQKIEHKIDKSGTLELSGPAIKKQFGVSTITLNEKQVVADPENPKNAVKLEVKPSFTAVAAMSATKEGAARVGRRGVGGATYTGTDPQVAVTSICETLVKAIEKLGQNPALKDSTVKALQGVRNAIDIVI